jgi:hypothetical protein
MSSTKRSTHPATSAPPLAAQPSKIDADAVYTTESVLTALPWAKASTLHREIKLGRLRASERCGRHLFLGQWLLDWIGAGELAKQPPPVSQADPSKSCPSREGV